MGYDVRIYSSARIPADKVEAAAQALWEAARNRELICEEDKLRTAEDIAEVVNEGFSESAFRIDVSDDGSACIECSDDYVRREEEDQWIFQAMGPFIEGDIDFEGEDGYKWRWSFSEKGLEELGSEVVYGNDVKAPDVVEKIIDVIYPDGRLDTEYGGDMLGALHLIENIIREAGFGPQAHMTELERLADV